MFYIPIQKDFSQVKNKVAFGLTKRQLICFAMAAAVGIPTYLFLGKTWATEIAVVVMITLMLPFFLFALYEKDGQTLEEVLRSIITEKYVRPRIRPIGSEPLIGSVIITADYIDECERAKREANSKNRILNMIRRGGSRTLDTE